MKRHAKTLSICGMGEGKGKMEGTKPFSTASGGEAPVIGRKIAHRTQQPMNSGIKYRDADQKQLDLGNPERIRKGREGALLGGRNSSQYKDMWGVILGSSEAMLRPSTGTRRRLERISFYIT